MNSSQKKLLLVLANCERHFHSLCRHSKEHTRYSKDTQRLQAFAFQLPNFKDIFMKKKMSNKFGVVVSAVTYGSGMGTTTAIMHLLEPGQHVIGMNDLYSGTYNYLHRIAASLKISSSLVDARDVQNIRRAVRDNTRVSRDLLEDIQQANN